MKLDVNYMVEVLSEALKPMIREGSFELSDMDLTEKLGFSLEKVIFNEQTGELTVIAPDRPEKSAVIGKGGWVVGRLKEELGINSIHVEAYSDMIVRLYRMDLALKKIKTLLATMDQDSSSPLENLKDLLEIRINNLAVFDFKDHFEAELIALKSRSTYYDTKSENKAIVALSGGVDSSFSLIVAKLLGFNPRAVTVDPGSIVLPAYFKKNVENICQALYVPHEYLKVDMTQVIEDGLEGRIHPCGRCSQTIEAALLKYADNSDIPFIIFGDFLATGYQSIVSTDGFWRINLPAMLSASKGDTSSLSSCFKIKSSGGYGCPLINEVHRLHPHMRRFSIQRILRETRAGVLEPGQALNLIARTL